MGAAVGGAPTKFARFVLMNTAAFRALCLARGKSASATFPSSARWLIRGLNLFARPPRAYYRLQTERMTDARKRRATWPS